MKGRKITCQFQESKVKLSMTRWLTLKAMLRSEAKVKRNGWNQIAFQGILCLAFVPRRADKSLKFFE